jgi:hypothetical protein
MRLNLPTIPDLQPPAAFYTLFPRTNTTPHNAGGNGHRQGSHRSSEKQPEKKETLISRFNLEQRITSGEEKVVEDDVGGKAAWENTAEKREASLRERKAKMILAARQ